MINRESSIVNRQWTRPLSGLEIVFFTSLAFAYLWIFRYYEPHLFWSAASYLILALLIFGSLWLHGVSRRQAGFRLDNFPLALRRVALPTALAVVVIVTAALWMGYRPFVPETVEVAALLGWALLQQIALQSFLLLRTRALLGPAGGVLLAASIFALVHSPNWPLVAACLLGGWFWCRAFLAEPNVYSTAVSHFAVSLALVAFVKDPWMNGFHVGPRWARYDAYGQGAIVAAGDVAGDERAEIVASRGPHPQHDSVVRIFNGAGETLFEFRAFDPSVTCGANLAVARNSKNKALVVAAPGPGRKNPPVVRLFEAGGKQVGEFVAFDDGGYGATVAAADLDGDGTAEIIAGRGPGPGLPSTVRVFEQSGRLRSEFRGLPDRMVNGVRVAAGDVDGDGRAEILCAPSYLSTNPSTLFVRDTSGRQLFQLTPVAGLMFGASAAALTPCQSPSCLLVSPGAGWWLRASVQLINSAGEEALYFEPFGPQARYGVNLASGDVLGTGGAQIIAGEGAGPDNGSRIAVYDFQSGRIVRQFRAF